MRFAFLNAIMTILMVILIILVLFLAADWGVYTAKLDCDKTGTFHWKAHYYTCAPSLTHDDQSNDF